MDRQDIYQSNGPSFLALSMKNLILVLNHYTMLENVCSIYEF